MPGRTTSVAFIGTDADLNRVADRVAAKLRGTATIAQEENAKIAASSEAAATKMGAAYEAGTTKAAAGLSRLSALGASFGLPMVGSLDAVSKKLDETTAKHEKLLGTMARAGKLTLTAGLAGFAAAAFEGVKGAMALQQAMERIHTQAGASQAEVVSMTKAVQGMAGSLATSPLALADSLYHVESSGFRGAQALNIMSAAAKEAKISGADLTDTTTALTAAVFSGISGAQNFSQAMGLLNATVGAGDMKFQNLNEAFAGPMLATVKGYGLSLRDVGASLAAFGDLNIRGADAATQLRMAVQYMARPAATAGSLLEKLGLSTHSFANAMSKGGLLPALQLLHDKLQAAGVKGSQMGQVVSELFTKKGAAGVTILENSLGKLEGKYGQVAKGASKQNEAWNASQKTLAVQMDKLKATVQSLGDRFGGWLIPKLEALAHAVSDVVGWFHRHQAAAQALAAVIGGVLGTAVAIFAGQKMASFVRWMGEGLAAIGRFAASAVIGTGRLIASFTTIGAGSEAMEAKVGAAAAGSGAQMQLFATETRVAGAEVVVAADTTAAGVDTALGSTGIGLVIVGLGIAATEMATHWDAVMHGMRDAVSAMVSAAEQALNGLISALNAAVDLFNSTIGQLTGQIGQINSVGTGGLGGGGSQLNLPVGKTQLMDLPGGGRGVGPGNISVPGSGSNAQRIAGALKAQGFSNVAIAGILGNFAQENGGQTLTGISTGDTAGGLGIAQWIGSRKSAEGTYAAIHHESPTSIQAEVGFLVQELRTSFHSVFNAIQGAKSPEAAALAFEQGYERAGIPNNPARERLAREAFGMLHGASGGGGGGGGGLSSRELNALLDSGKPHHAAKAVRSLLYANPFPGGASIGRTDMGVDFSARPGSAVNAIGAGVIDKIIGNWFKGQPLVEEKLTQGPNAGKFVYYAEQLNALVKEGQKVRAGQRIGTVAASGTGLELGFGAGGGRTLAQATTGYTEGQVTPAGQAFRRFLGSIGAHGVYQTTKGGVVSGGGSNIGITLGQLIQAYQQALTKAGNALLTKLNNLIQSGTAKSLEKALGVSTAAQIQTGTSYSMVGHGKHRHRAAHPIMQALSAVLYGDIETPGSIQTGTTTALGGHGLTKTLSEAVGKIHASALRQLDKDLGERWGTATASLVKVLAAEHAGALSTLVSKLEKAHSAPLRSLGHSLAGHTRTVPVMSALGADFLTRGQERQQAGLLSELQSGGSLSNKQLGTLLSLQSSALRHIDAKIGPQLSKVADSSPQGKAFNTQVLALLAAGQKGLADRLVAAHRAAITTLAQELYAEQVTKDAELLSLQATALKDQTTLETDTAQDRLNVQKASAQLVADKMAAQVAYIRDMTQQVTDQFATVVSAIEDATHRMADSSDALVQAVTDRTQIQVDILGERGLYGLNLIAQKEQVQLDQMKASDDAQINLAKQNVDAVSASAHAAESLARLSLDQLTTQQNQLVAAARQASDTVSVSENLKILRAQQKSDNTTLHEDMSIVGPAQTAVDLGATLPKGQQDVLNAVLRRAQGQAALAEGKAQASYQRVYDAAQSAITTADNAVTAAQGAADSAIAQANQTLVIVTGQGDQAIAIATGTLQEIEDSAAQSEAPLQSLIEILKAQASTQFAGTGATVNIYGIPASNAAAIGDAVDWVARTQLTTG